MIEETICKLKDFLAQQSVATEESHTKFMLILKDMVGLILQEIDTASINNKQLLAECLDDFAAKLNLVYANLNSSSASTNDLESLYHLLQTSLERLQPMIFFDKPAPSFLENKIARIMFLSCSLIDAALISYTSFTYRRNIATDNTGEINSRLILSIAALTTSLMVAFMCSLRTTNKRGELYSLAYKGSLFFSDREKFNSLDVAKETKALERTV